MGIFDDSFSMELKHPIDKETWKIIEDAELDNTEHIYFTTPSGKRVDFIKADLLDKIRADIETMGGDIETIVDALAIIDKHRESEEDT